MSHVSGQLTAQLIECVESTDWPYPVDLSGLDEQALRSTSAWIPWDQYVGLLLAITGGSRDADRLRNTGLLHAAYGARGPFRHVGGITGGLRALYQASFGWVMASVMKCVTAEVVDTGPSRIRLEVRLDPDFSPSQPFFDVLAGSAIGLPRNLGMVDATLLEVETGPYHGRYEVLLPASSSLTARTRRAWSALFDSSGFDEAAKGLRDSIEMLVRDLKQTNARLAASEARLRTLTDSLPGVVVVLGATGDPESVHGSAIPSDEVIDGIVEAFRTPERLTAILEEHRMISFDATRGDGAWSWACRASHLPGTGSAVVVAVDDTEPRRTRVALLDAQKLEALGRVSGGVAHDFNNILAAIRGNAELLELDGPDHPRVRLHTSEILDAVERASGLTQQLLAFARRQDIATEVLDVSRVVLDATDMLSRIVGDDVELTTDCQPSLHVEADENRLHQVLLNLVVNARDALPAGGRIAIATSATEDQVVLSVSDDGVGMSSEVLAHATEPFFTTKEVGRGTGLGLSTVFGIVEQWGARVEIRSDVGAGTTARVVFPRRHEPLPAVAREPTGSEPAPGSETILLVEDDPKVRGVVQRALVGHGYRVVACEHANAALDEVEQLTTPPNLLVTDITMPGRSGIQLAVELAERYPTLRVLLMSGYLRTDRDPADDLPCPARFLAKPFSLTELGCAVRELIDVPALPDPRTTAPLPPEAG